ncbi:aldo/keto reductase [Gracilimonas sp.]|uniref:aldo/keto reductase n=1 Tax=Gracilimonas sp. TaxID=1974203 RepID=UPI002870E709|nr:aldo/keto reductase [Gracilimonas sp.]
MKYTQLGSTNIKVSEISFGCMSLEIDKGLDHNSKLIRKAYKSGINFFDTADLYDKGLNEKVVGTALNPFRENTLISTKVGNEWKENGSGWDWNPSKEHILTAVNESLRRLQTDYIDLYMLHGGTIDDPIDETIEAFERLKKQGKIRAYGISSIRPNTIREWVKRSNMDCVMMQYSLLDKRPEEEILDLLAENDISVITRGTLAKGLLINKSPKEYLNYSVADFGKLQSEIKKMGNPTALSIQYVLQHTAVASAVLGIRTNEQLRDIIQHFDDPVSEETLEKLSSVLASNHYSKHR